MRAVRCASEGEALMSPSVTRRLIAEFASRPDQRPVATDALGELTDIVEHTHFARETGTAAHVERARVLRMVLDTPERHKPGGPS